MRLGRVAYALALLLLLSGCGNSAVDIAPIVKALLAAGGLAAARTAAGNAAKHYFEQRVRFLVDKNSGWAKEKDYPSLVARLSSEMAQLAQLITDRVNILTGTDPKAPKHRDLRDAAKRMTTDGQTTIDAQFGTNVTERKDRIAQIVWRAGAIQSELWSGGDSTLAPTLQKDPLIEMVDRRLHSVEMLILHDEGKIGKWSVTSATSGWKDEQRTSMFQYPWVRYNDGGDFPAALAAAGLTVAGLAPDWIEGKDEIDFKVQQRLRPASAPDWTWDQPNYRMTLNGGVQASAALERMMPGAPTIAASFEDFFDRNFVYCDIMLAALHVEGLRFSRRRRKGNDTEFDASAASGVTLRPLIPKSGPPATQQLMADGAKWFEGVAVPHDALQVGDHLVFWNNQFVRFILSSAFGLENSYVTRIGANGYDVMLAGHGMPETSEQKFAEEMAGEMKTTYEKLVAHLNAQASPAPVLGVKASGGRSFQLVNWAPFDESFTPDSARPPKLKQDGAWWIRLKRSILHDASDPAPSMDEALALIPTAVRVQSGMIKPTLPAGDFDPDYQEAIYLPLSVPSGVSGGWPAYFTKHKGSGEFVELVDLIPDGKMVPGFFLKGKVQDSKVPVLRPKVQMT